jgi:hypothetical protein
VSRRQPLELVGIHGLEIRSADPAALARRLSDLLGLPVLRRSRGEIVLGRGPELFIAVRRAGRSQPEGVEEVHVAVKEIAASRRKAREDALGGDSWTRPLDHALSLTVREFRRAPGKAWRRKRPPT